MYLKNSVRDEVYVYYTVLCVGTGYQKTGSGIYIGFVIRYPRRKEKYIFRKELLVIQHFPQGVMACAYMVILLMCQSIK